MKWFFTRSPRWRSLARRRACRCIPRRRPGDGRSSAHAGRGGAARDRAQSRSGDRPARHGGRGRARRREPRRLHAHVFDHGRAVPQRDAAGERAVGDTGRGREGLVLVDRRHAARAVGRRHLERVVGHRADDDQQPDQQLRSEPAVGHPVRVLAAAPAGPRDRCVAAAVHRGQTQSRQLRAAVSRIASSRRSRPSSRRTGR